jgi:hypothetical protein
MCFFLLMETSNESIKHIGIYQSVLIYAPLPTIAILKMLEDTEL